MDGALEQAQAVALANVILHPEKAASVFSQVRIEDFDGQYRAVAEALHGLRLAKADISQLSVVDEMTRRGTIGRIGGQAEVFRIAGHFGSAEYACQVIARVARLRRLAVTGVRLAAFAEQAEADPHPVAQAALTELQAVVDGIEADGDVTTPSLREFLDTSDAPYDWVIPGLLERGDRLVLTGSEGLGKSELFRQLAVCAAAGVHPFTHRRVEPKRVLYVDCENGTTRLRRVLRPLAGQAGRHGSDPGLMMNIEAIPQGLDLTRPEDEIWLVRRVAALQPDLLLIGPVYRLHAKNPNDEEPARKVTQVLDRCRAAAHCAVAVEAHAGHASNGDRQRPIRPTGSSLWLRWPEYGYGLRAGDHYDPADRAVDLVPWRGDREERAWPKALRSGGVFPWSEDVTSGNSGWSPSGVLP